jgi:NADPH:quinone reductase-like Zn-dependent oxidoreductase
MKAMVMREHGDLSVLEMAEMPSPELRSSTDVRISLRAAALNRLDLWTLGGLPGLKLTFPHILGGDGAGMVDAVGAEVSTVQTGDRVLLNPGISCHRCESCREGEQSLCYSYRLLGEHVPGTLCEQIVVPEENVFRIPEVTSSGDVISWEEAAAYPLATLTAWRMLITKAKVRPGDLVLIWGIGGGVATAALGIAKLAGAFTIVTSSSEAKLATAREMGADVGFNHASVDVAKEVRKLTDRRGVDVVVETVGEATWEQSLRSLAKGGRLVTCGATTGPRVVTDVRRLFWHQHQILGSTMGNTREFREIVRALGQGKLRPRVDSVVPFANAKAAFERLESGEQVGKIVVRVS